MTMTRPDLPVVPGPAQLPDRWPSAWPSLRGQVLVSALFPVLTTVFTGLALLGLQLLAISWWVPLLPLLVLPAPLTLPARARRAVQRADNRRDLRVREIPEGLEARAPRRALRRRIVARVHPGQRVVYRLRRG